METIKGVQILIILATIELIHFCSGHGRLMEPPNRSSIWRFQEFFKYSPIPNYDDNQLFCGGASVQYLKNGGKCGACGDDFSDPVPRDNENGGKYGRGIIVRKYKSSQTIPIAVELTRSHLGYFEFSICPLKSKTDVETESCFTKPLELSNGAHRLIINNYTGYYNTTLILPNMSCARCVFRWHYRAGNSWGDCGNGTSGLGCGNQETFRGCADISIS